MTKPKYLIKFVKRKEHAEFLLDGNLFMYPAGYYRYLANSVDTYQADSTEGAMSHQSEAYKGLGRPIYCMYTVDDTDLYGEKIIISKRCIEDFSCSDGYLVIVQCDLFLERLSTLNTMGYAVRYGKVGYGVITDEIYKQLIVDSNSLNLFIKRPCYSHQKEFRIVVYDRINPNIVSEIRNGCMLKCVDKDNPYNSRTYSMLQSLRDIARMIPIRELPQINDNYIISLDMIR